MSPVWRIAGERHAEHLALGHAGRHFFSHDIRYIPHCGVDGYQLANRLVGATDVNDLWQVTLHALPDDIRRYPQDLFFDPELIWHQQHFGIPGLVANANLVLRRDRLYVTQLLSDLVQRISRRRQYRSRIENQFKGWPLWLLNSALHLAGRLDLKAVQSPTAELVLAHTDRNRSPGPALFKRVYDDSINRWYEARRVGDWWEIDVARNHRRLVAPTPVSQVEQEGTLICVCHDIERGLGHRDLMPDFAREADKLSSGILEKMLEIESDVGVRATYNVVAIMLNEVRAQIEQGGHSLGFHSYDHNIDRWWPVSKFTKSLLRRARKSVDKEPEQTPLDQLSGCRRIDYRIPGFRPPQSRITTEYSGRNLSKYRFSWLASSVSSLKLDRPTLADRVAQIPIALDDSPLFTRQCNYANWQTRLRSLLDDREFLAISLHDCYGPLWIDHYRELLQFLGQHGRLATLDDVANQRFLHNAM